MRHITTAALILGVAASAFAAKPSQKAPKITAADKKCAAACTAHMKAKGMPGSCPAAMCASGACPMVSKSSHPTMGNHAKAAKSAKAVKAAKSAKSAHKS